MQYGVTNEAFKLELSRDGIIEAGKIYGKTRLRTIAARGDWAVFQLLLSADEDFCVNISGFPWFSKNGPILNARVAFSSPFEVKCYIEETVTDDDGVKKADMLLEQDTIEIKAGTPLALFCQIDVPRGATPGKYIIKADIFESKMFSNEAATGSIEVELDVYAAELPAKKTFFLDLWQHTCNIARKHDVPLFSDRHFAVLEKYVRSLAELGQKSVTIIAGEAPWRGQSCYLAEINKSNLFEYSMARVEKLADGSFAYDFSIIEKYISLCATYGISDEIEVFGLLNIWADPEHGFGRLVPDYPDYIKIRYLDRKDGCFKYLDRAEDIDRYIKALESFFIEKGLINNVVIAADEPADLEMYRESLARIKKTAPAFKFKTAINHTEFIEEFSKDISCMAPILYCVSSEWEKWLEYLHSLKDKRFLWYVCCTPEHPNTFIRSNLLENRFIGILTSYMNFDGFLRWNYTVWPDDPRREIRYGTFPAGDTNFVYPANDGSVILTLRYKQLKRGIEDFELLKLLKDKGMDDAARRAFGLVVKESNPGKYYPAGAENIIPLDRIMSLEYDDYLKFKELVLESLSLAQPSA